MPKRTKIVPNGKVSTGKIGCYSYIVYGNSYRKTYSLYLYDNSIKPFDRIFFDKNDTVKSKEFKTLPSAENFAIKKLSQLIEKNKTALKKDFKSTVQQMTYESIEKQARQKEHWMIRFEREQDEREEERLIEKRKREQAIQEEILRTTGSISGVSFSKDCKQK